MQFFIEIFLVCAFLTFTGYLCQEQHIWHSHQFHRDHQNREEIFVTNITSDDAFKLDYKVACWKSLRVDKINFVAGSIENENKILIASIQLDPDKNTFFINSSYTLNFDMKPISFVLLENWNSTLKKTEVIAVIATEKQQLLWYRLQENQATKFWCWNVEKNITYISYFEIEHNPHLLVTTQYASQTSADLYQFELRHTKNNFWLRQKIQLEDSPQSSALTNFGPHYFLSIPQQSLNLLQIYKLTDNHFTIFANLTSKGINSVTSFSAFHRSFIAINGFNAGIYKFTKVNSLTTLTKEGEGDSNLSGVEHWLPISLNEFDEILLMAQLKLDHGLHKSFVIDVFTYDGVKFEEHEDISCLYFGEEISGLSCLPGEESPEGIVGAVGISLGDVSGILVPRTSRNSELFMVRSVKRRLMNPVEIEVKELRGRRKYLQNLMDSQMEGIDKIRNSILGQVRDKNFDFDNLKDRLQIMENDIQEMADKLGDIKKNENSSNFQTVIFNGPVKVNSGNFNEVSTKKINGKPADLLLGDIFMKDSGLDVVDGLKTFSNLIVENLAFDKVNEINATNLIFEDGMKEELILTGNVALEKPLTVQDSVNSDKVNGLVFEDEVIQLQKPIEDKLKFDNIVVGDLNVEKIHNIRLKRQSSFKEPDWNNAKFETLIIPNNVRVSNLNGDDFDGFLHKLCLKNVKCEIPQSVQVDGDVLITGTAKTETINNLKFPLEYVFGEDSFPNITGRKNFVNSLITYEIYAEGTIDGIVTSDVVTLTTNQEIRGTTTFADLEIRENFEVDGDIIGKHANKFLSNPILNETDLIKGNVYFRNLEVEGSIFLSNNLNGKNFGFILSDKVYKNEENVLIGSRKQFPDGFSVRGNLFINSNSINNVNLESLVTKNTDQDLNITTLNGIVNFNNLQINGQYNGINITDLDQQLVRVDGQQFISSTIIFEDELIVNELEVLQTINELSEDEIIDLLDKGEEVDNDTTFDVVEIHGNFLGEFDNFDIQDFDRRRLSLSRDQTVEGVYQVEEASIENLEIIKLNDVDFNEFDQKFLLSQLQTNLGQGKIDVENLFVSGDLEVNKINGIKAVYLGDTMWIGGVQSLNTTNIFVNEVYFDNELKIQNLSGVGFQRWVDTLVFKNDSDMKVSGVKTFLEGFSVEKFIETEQLNYIPIDRILTKYGFQEIAGPIVVRGNVNFNDSFEVAGNVNGVPLELMRDSYDISGDGCKVKGDVLFSHLAHINNLRVEGFVEDHLHTVQEVLDGLVYKDSDFRLEGRTFFENKVNIKGNLRIVDKINEVNLPAFVSNMVLVTKDVDINGPVRFSAPVLIKEQLNIGGNLRAETLNDIVLESWLKKAIFLDRGLLKGNYSFEEVKLVDNLHTDYINNIDMTTLIPLRTKQNISEMSFGLVRAYKDIKVGNSTNLHNLTEEYSNTVMTPLNQEIHSDLEFLGDIIVDGNIHLAGSLNNKDASKIVTTNTDQELNSVFNFKSKIVVDKNLDVSGLVNGINVTLWFKDGVKIDSSEPQVIKNDWEIKNELIFEEDVDGTGVINGVDFHKFKNQVDQRRHFKYVTEEGFIKDYLNICKDLTYMNNRLKKQIYKFDYFTYQQVLDFQNNVYYLHRFKFGNNVYFLIGEENRCESYLFLFTNAEFKFISDAFIGRISQIVTVYNNDLLFFVVKSDNFNNGCEIQGTNIWKFASDTLTLLLTMEDQDVLQESLVPGTFYGIKNQLVTEFKIIPEPGINLQKYRKWEVDAEDMAFVPRGLGTGLALRTGTKLIKLNRDEPVIEDVSISSLETEIIIRGNVTEEINGYLPGHKDSDMVVLKVGMKNRQRSLLAVASYEETSVRGSLDFIKIYEDISSGRVFQKIAAYKPSALTALEFGNGETFLAYLENQSVLKIYEYKGIEGFKEKLSAKLEGSKLFSMKIPLFPFKSEKKILGLINKNRVTFMEAVMLGNQVEEDLQCALL